MNIRTLARTLSDTAASMRRRYPEANTQEAISVVLAHALAYNLPLPTSEVDSPNNHFINTFLSGVEETVGALNEYYILDIDPILHLTRELWITRYNAVYRPTSPEAYAHTLSYLKHLDLRVAPRVAKLANFAAAAEMTNDYEVLELVAELCESQVLMGSMAE